MKTSSIPPLAGVCVMIIRKLVQTGIFLLFMVLCGYSSDASTDTLLIRRPAATGKSQRKPDTLSKERSQYRAQMLKELQRDLDGILEGAEITNTNIGVSAQYTETGEFLYRRNDEKNFIPASNLKLITTAAALEYLGKDFRYRTLFYLDGTANRGGEFIGNIIIRGGGDPTLSQFFYRDATFIFDAVFNKLDSLGITSIRGNIIADDTYFTDEPYPKGWSIEDIPFAFSPEVSGLNYYDNTVEFHCETGIAASEKPHIDIIPENEYVTYINDLITTDSNYAPTAEGLRSPESNSFIISGGIPLRKEKSNVIIQSSIHKPALYFASILRSELERRGIRIRGSLLQSKEMYYFPNYPSLVLLAEQFSPALSDIVLITNRFSHNLCAEVLLKTIAKEKTGIGSFENGIEMIKKFLTKYGIKTEKLSIADGSGLSRLNLCSPLSFVKVLNAMYNSPNRDEFIASLAIPGERGTLHKRLTNSRAETNIFAKTGSMASVSTISGYALTRDREPVSFSIMFNGFTVPFSVIRSLEDLVCMRLASFSRK
ncbi:MAG: D-alanyl-D-alanine carboxypeptidase/D-alanyl-D-alanine-endopeptidase [Ignavibacteria bacterium]|nr:D-alanyl-D-alanine carboxypeptidase/D-alanyl-D-alanine-endopeptidase [Ignavibacteria bacterium]